MAYAENVWEQTILGSLNSGPDAKERFLQKAGEACKRGCETESIFYQVRALYQAKQDRYFARPAVGEEEAYDEEPPNGISQREKDALSRDPLMREVLNAEKQSCDESKATPKPKSSPRDFLSYISNAEDGYKKIEDVCSQMPKEWTILQVCKNCRRNTYSKHIDLLRSEAPVYLSILRHARSAEYPRMICLELPVPEKLGVFKIAKLLFYYSKHIYSLFEKNYRTTAAQCKFWTRMQWFDEEIELSLKAFKKYISPWNFLFIGQLHPYEVNKQYQQQVFRRVDKLCDACDASMKQRVLLSLAALHVNAITGVEIVVLCKTLFTEEAEQMAAQKLLFEQRMLAIKGDSAGHKPNLAHFPCILVMDEHMDHFFWEELHPKQEYTRINSLQCLWQLYTHHQAKIQNGYLLLSAEKGSCLVNPDLSLPKAGIRMKSFFQYWLPHWNVVVGRVPDSQQFYEIYQQPCYVYAGHGSGLQFHNARNLSDRRINAVVFLFGCNSTSLCSPGLYGEKMGAHVRYLAAMCPAVVGTVLPCLDGWTDSIAAHILSHWLKPSSSEVKPWHYFDQGKWITTFKRRPTNECSIIIFDSDDSTEFDILPSVSVTPDYHIGSLCAVVAQVHQRKYNPKFYHTVPYVIRGLPVWNTDVQRFPFAKDGMINEMSELKMN